MRVKLQAIKQELRRRMHAAAAKSEGLDDQGTDCAVGQRLAPTTANPSPLAPMRALQSDTRGGSRMLELGPYGSVRGARGNSRPYRDPRPKANIPCLGLTHEVLGEI
jgi:hypothetical protein